MEASLVKTAESLDLKQLKKILDKFRGKKGTLIPILQETQKVYGYLPKTALIHISEFLNLDVSRVFGVATFYAQFRLTPVGRHMIRVCHGTACHVSGATRVSEICEEELGIEDGQTSEDLEYTLESVACLGCCSLAPVMTVDENTYGRLTDREVRKVIAGIKKT